MRRLFLGILVFVPALALAQFHDHDGHLQARWQAPAVGTPLSHYLWSYTINGRADSLTGIAAAGDTLHNTVILAEVGDWAVFKIRAISVVHDTSTWAVSDTAIYDTDTGIGPPRGVSWIQGP